MAVISFERNRKYIAAGAVVAAASAAFLFIRGFTVTLMDKAPEWSFQALERALAGQYLLLTLYPEKEAGQDPLDALSVYAAENSLLSYPAARGEAKEQTEDIPVKEGSDEDRKNLEEEQLDYGEDALHIDKDLLAELQSENDVCRQKEAEDTTLLNSALEENIAYRKSTGELPEFTAAKEPAFRYDFTQEWTFEDMVSHFFAVDSLTALDRKYVEADKLLSRDLTLRDAGEGPQILIYHTHSQEGFADSVPGDQTTTILGAGERLAQILEEEYGFRVLHHEGQYDVENRDDAYSLALPAIERILQENPSIQVVIDLHRDEMKEGKKLVMDLQGRPTARFMFFNGMSYLRKKGAISYLENPYIQDNLALSFQAQVAANEYYPGITRKIYLKAYRYNMHLCPRSMLIELGAQTNTVEEIMNACEPLAHIISIVLNGNL